MRNTPYLAAAASAALLALTGCNNEPVQINTVEADTSAPPLNVTELPPTIVASKIYRCSDNSLFYITFYSDNSAMLRRGSATADGTRLSGTAATGPFTAEGNSVSGNGDNVTINGRSCRS